jgi:hypothetical protein
VFIGCTWCNLRTQRCWCVTPCGVHCDAEWYRLPVEYPTTKVTKHKKRTYGKQPTSEAGGRRPA